MNFFTSIFCISFLHFRNTYLKEQFSVAASIYFNRDASRENTTHQANLRGVIISWKNYLFHGK